MKEEVLDSIKKEYEKKKKSKERCEKIINRISMLEQDDKVKEYLKLVDYMKDATLLNNLANDEELIKLSYMNHKFEIKDTENIYVYIGTYQYSYGNHSSDYRVCRLDPGADYRLYQNIENESYMTVKIDECEKFEKDNLIVDTGNYFSQTTFYCLQAEFYKDAIEFGQEEAKRRVLNKSKIRR